MKIKRARERLMMTQAELGARVRKSQKTIDNWEHDRSYPKSSIGALEQVLGVSVDGQPEASLVPPGLVDFIRRSLPPDRQDAAIMALEEVLSPPPEPAPPAGGQRPEAGRSEPRRHAG
jgi:DNA-binding XRE family transcriptional regulator